MFKKNLPPFFESRIGPPWPPWQRRRISAASSHPGNIWAVSSHRRCLRHARPPWEDFGCSFPRSAAKGAKTSPVSKSRLIYQKTTHIYFRTHVHLFSPLAPFSLFSLFSAFYLFASALYTAECTVHTSTNCTVHYFNSRVQSPQPSFQVSESASNVSSPPAPQASHPTPPDATSSP